MMSETPGNRVFAGWHGRCSLPARMLQDLDRGATRTRSVQSLVSRALRRLTRWAAPRGAAWRAFSERQACLAQYGHELLAEPRASHAEAPGGSAGVIAEIAVGAHADRRSAMSMTAS